MGEILLDWDGHDKALSNKLWEFFNEGYMVDFSVTCHGQQKNVHRFILVHLMPILKQSLGSSEKHEDVGMDGVHGESSNILLPQCLNLDNVAHHAEDMDYLIEFAYTGKTSIPKEHADCMLHIADSMEIKSLKESLCQWHCKGELVAKAERKDDTIRSCLGPETHPKNVEHIDENTNIVCFHLDIPSIFNHESTMDRSLNSCDSQDEKITSSTKEKEETKQNFPPQMFESNEDDSKRKPTIKRKTTTFLQKPTKTDSIDEVNSGDEENPSNEQIAKSKDDGANGNKSRKNTKQIVCKLCDKVFGNRSQLAIHRDCNCGTEYPYVCKYCGHKCVRKIILKQHIMAKHHVDMDGNPLEMNIQCTKCDFVCYANHQLRAHQRIKHESENKHKCKECNFSAPDSTRLWKHVRFTHNNIREFKCEECGKKFHRKEVLNNHVLTVHMGVKKYACDICGMKYRHKQNFKLHMRCHSDNVTYNNVCGTCGLRTKTISHLSNHMRSVHGIDYKREAKREKKKILVEGYVIETTTDNI